MKCSALSLTSVVALLVASAAAGDFVEEMQRDFKMALLPRQLATNLQAFSGKLGGEAAPAITNSGNPERPFEVDGDTFTDFQSAAGRACDNQKNLCANQANSNKGGSLEVGDCDKQNDQCKQAASSATVTSFATLTSSTADFDIFCE
ncbi:hypothetical protein JX265_000614 [Neoarthrinium moseri]|uniref:Uncharacterized protein n=2 Tax=Neoarthrinium moseri TaxID=1658444 RepID=A0A9Q0ASE4_9PEZI|nr:hypothetical protein JX266_001351 [Neoarthrinium moseri]KAI1881788.1 hypothetical protein JX265_000614 [Neoarthrinium moseri]